ARAVAPGPARPTAGVTRRGQGPTPGAPRAIGARRAGRVPMTERTPRSGRAGRRDGGGTPRRARTGRPGARRGGLGLGRRPGVPARVVPVTTGSAVSPVVSPFCAAG